LIEASSSRLASTRALPAAASQAPSKKRCASLLLTESAFRKMPRKKAEAVYHPCLESVMSRLRDVAFENCLSELRRSIFMNDVAWKREAAAHIGF
jgi:hypothetical protein